MAETRKIISRETYLKKIEPFMHKSIIKVFTGQRRVGKSYMLFQVIKRIQELDSSANIIYINKEDIEFELIADAKTLNDYIVSKCVSNQRNYIFIDEIQDINEFEKALRSLLLIENNDIYITGSNANMLSGELATYLSGRYIEIEVHSLSYQEFLLFHQFADTEDNFVKYAKYGGLPYLINLPLTDEVVFEYLKNVYTTILFRDVVNRFNIRNTLFLEKLIRFVANNTGSVFSAKSISDYLKAQQTNIAPNQIQIYLSHLVAAFLLYEIQRFDLVGKKIFSSGEKFFFENLGIRNAIVGYKPQDFAKILENLVHNHLIFMGYKVKVGLLGSSEIDFICEKDSEKIYVQVALRLTDESTIQREFGNLLKIPDNYPKYVITSEHFQGNTYEGIKHMQIREFLTITRL